MMGTTTLVNTAIMQVEKADNTLFFRNRVAPIYQEAYILDKLYANIAAQIDILILLPLLLIYLRQTAAMLK